MFSPTLLLIYLANLSYAKGDFPSSALVIPLLKEPDMDNYIIYANDVVLFDIKQKLYFSESPI